MVVAVSSSPSSAPPSDGRIHPTYKEMVVQALTELRDPGGSSRDAIGKYIADHFTGLHSSHEELLSAHLRRLIYQGQLRLVSGNYFLSTEASPPRRGRGRPPKLKRAAPGPKKMRGPGRPRKNADLAPSTPIPSSQGPKRGPGRPRKNSLAPAVSSASPLLGASASPPASGVKRGRGRPRKNPLVPAASSASPPPGVVAPPPPSGGKRGRGRPRKNVPVTVASSASPLPGASGSLTPSGVKRGRGRPRKNALVPVASSAPLLPGAITPPPSGVKRGRGRPPKNALILLASSVPHPGAVTPPPSGVKRGRGRPRKNALIPVAASSLLPLMIAQPPPSGVKRGRGRPCKNSYPVGLPRLGGVSVSRNNVVGAKRGRGHPPKAVVAGKKKRGRPPKEKKQPESVQSADAPWVKRGPGRPRKEKTVESGQLNAAQMSERQHEALPAQAVDQAGVVQNEVEAGSLQSFGTPLTEKRGRGRPRKRPLETETAETGVAALTEKRARGRPRKENPSAGRSTESGLTASTGIKRGRGRPRKVKPFETGCMETAVEVSGDLIEVKSEKDEDLASGTKSDTQDVILVEEMDALPADDGCVLVSREEAVPAPMDAGGVMPGVVTGEEATIASMDAGGAMPGVVSGEEAAVAPMDAGAAMPGVDLVDSNVGTKSH
ncbi:unnamed protein product [Urochloa decumbens]|uniref:H15 domain-containing protein n=2 Tax=Urochloa decumbens TaxID=240449 RepID=A0ABC9DS00_9POAL